MKPFVYISESITCNQRISVAQTLKLVVERTIQLNYSPTEIEIWAIFENGSEILISPNLYSTENKTKNDLFIDICTLENRQWITGSIQDLIIE